MVPACSPVLEICVVTAETAHFMMMGRIVSILEVHVESSTDGDASADHRKCAVSSMLHRNLVTGLIILVSATVMACCCTLNISAT